MGNLRSVAKALEAAGANVVVSAEAEEIGRADALCVPGQGIFGRCMTRLAETRLDDVIRTWIGEGRPYLGICLGLQVLFEQSEERGPVAGLRILRGRVARLPGPVKVPHIGWNTVEGSVSEAHYYFDHSFAVQPADPAIVTGWCDHGVHFAARVESGSILAVQFHPEKSGAAGLALLKGWCDAA